MKLSSQANASQEFQEVLLLRLPYFYGYAFRVLGNAAEAEDAVQDALMAAHKNVNQFRGQAQMSTWLMTIVRNCALMQLRRRSRHNLLSLDQRVDEKQPYFVGESLSDGRPSPEDEFRHTELAARLRRCTRLLSPTLRRTFQLRVMDGLSTTEIAEHLGVPLGTVKAQLARARAKIARHIKPGLAPRFRPRQHQPTEAQ
ncbi:MAG TPA: sigma-70 family RNA polymerase sigma factor [Candidatus Binatia bacterium]|nr:sigma-70 family RNA polymerase sigma factor [Candidatus Binatia bacterium]